MSLLGNIVRENKKQAAAVPPAPTVTAANNGTSLSGTTVQLGQALGAVGNPAILLNNREVPMGGFDFQFINGAGRKFLLDPSGVTQYILGDVDNIEGHNAHIDVLGSLGFIQATLFTGAGPVGMFNIGSNGTGALVVSDGAGKQYGYELFNNALKARYIETGNGESGLLAQTDGANPQVAMQALDNTMQDFLQAQLSRAKFQVIGAVGGNTAIPLDLDLTNNVYRIGDTGPYNNNTFLEIDDAAKRFYCNVGANPFMLIDLAAQYCAFGDDYASLTGAEISVSLNPANKSVFLCGGNSNNSFLTLSDTSQFLRHTVNTVKLFNSEAAGISTAEPNGVLSDGQWLLGKQVSAVVAFDATQYIEVKIDGVLYKLALAA